MINYGVFGECIKGRLGLEILKEIENDPSIKLVACVSSKNNLNIGKKI